MDDRKKERAKELAALVEGLVARGVPANLAQQTVKLIYQMGRIDERMQMKVLELEERR